MGQGLGLSRGATRLIGATSLGAMESQPAWEFKEPRVKQWGPLWRAAATTKGGGVTVC